MSLLRRASRVKCSSLELEKALPSPHQHAAQPYKITLALSNNMISKMKNGTFSRLSLLGNLPWSPLLPETTGACEPDCYPMTSTVCAAAGGHDDVHSPCCHQSGWSGGIPTSVLPLESILMSVVCAATTDVCGPCCPGNHVEGQDPCCHWLSWARVFLLQWC